MHIYIYIYICIVLCSMLYCYVSNVVLINNCLHEGNIPIFDEISYFSFEKSLYFLTNINPIF